MPCFWNSVSSEASTGKVKKDLKRKSLTLNVKMTAWGLNSGSGPGQPVCLYFPEIPDQAEARRTLHSLTLLSVQLANTGRPVLRNSWVINDLDFVFPNGHISAEYTSIANDNRQGKSFGLPWVNKLGKVWNHEKQEGPREANVSQARATYPGHTHISFHCPKCLLLKLYRRDVGFTYHPPLKSQYF